MSKRSRKQRRAIQRRALLEMNQAEPFAPGAKITLRDGTQYRIGLNNAWHNIGKVKPEQTEAK